MAKQINLYFVFISFMASSSIKIAVGSTNRVKIDAVREAIKMININAVIESVNVDSGVSKQPYCEETFIGARNRAYNALAKVKADIGIGIEGGICTKHEKVLAYAVVYAKGNDGLENFAYSAAFALPNKVVEMINKGYELGDVIDKVYNKTNSKFNEGAVGILTKVISRKDLYVQPVIMALYPFYNAEVL